MQYTIDSEKRKKFVPVTVNIIIETEAEMAWILTCSNKSIAQVKDNTNSLDEFSIEELGDAQMSFYECMLEARKESNGN